MFEEQGSAIQTPVADFSDLSDETLAEDIRPPVTQPQPTTLLNPPKKNRHKKEVQLPNEKKQK